MPSPSDLIFELAVKNELSSPDNFPWLGQFIQFSNKDLVIFVLMAKLGFNIYSKKT